MVRLLLTSAGFTNPNVGKKFVEVLRKDPAKARVFFVPTAAYGPDCDASVLSYAGASMKQLTDCGIRPEHFVMFDAEDPIERNRIGNIDVVYVCGGNTFYLLRKLRGTGFDKVIAQLVEGGALYVGVSAGSILPGPDIRIAAPYDANDERDRDTTGLKLTKLVISPHFQRKELSAISDFEKQTKLRVTGITDSQAVLEIDGKSQIIE